MRGLARSLPGGIGLVAWLVFAGCSNDHAYDVSYAGLLEEMVDPYAITYLPQYPYAARSWSSYDRASVVPGEDGWFANGDFSQFIRTETNSEGRIEAVMVDAPGPGAMTRLWLTLARSPENGVIRMYVDGRCELAGALNELTANSALGGKPLVCVLPEKAVNNPRALNIYLPVTYARSLKITYENASLWNSASDGGKPLFFYNVETRKFAAGVDVEPFSKEVLRKREKDIEYANMKLMMRDRGNVRKGGASSTFDGRLPPGKSHVGEFEGPGAIGYLAMNVNSNLDALKEVLVEFSFDGEDTVSVPIAHFFGCGISGEPFSQWCFSTDADGVMESHWTMPYRERATFALNNLGTNVIHISDSCITTFPYEWIPERSMHFGATWKLMPDAPAVRDGNPYDVVCLSMKGSGRVVGTSLCVINRSVQWWGEGDEKVFVDGERFPSYFGTGTEDYFGSAFCSTNKFSHVFVAQPIPYGSSDRFSGLGQYNRIRRLDDIPFAREITFLFEISHVDPKATLLFSPVTFWYARPGARQAR